MLSIVVVTRQCYFNNRLSEFSVFTFFCSWKVHEAWLQLHIHSHCGKRWLLFDLAFHNTVTDKSVFSLLRRLSTWHCPHLSVSAAPAARRRCCWAPAIDRYLLPTGHSAANPLHAAAAVDRRDGQMNGRSTVSQGCSGAGTWGDGVPHFFGLKFVQKLVHCCNWLLSETQRKIISVQQNYYSM